jgi:Flp pilus assembly pilin Flp
VSHLNRLKLTRRKTKGNYSRVFSLPALRSPKDCVEQTFLVRATMKKHHKNGLTLIELLVLIAIIAIAVIGYLYFFTGKESDTESEPYVVQSLDTPEKAAKAYFDTGPNSRNIINERLKTVMDPERIKPLLVKNSRRVTPIPEGVQAVFSVNHNSSLLLYKPNITLVAVGFSKKGITTFPNQKPTYIVKHHGNYLVDYEATIQHNPQSLIEFKTKFPSSQKARFRLKATLDSYYTGDFKGTHNEQNFYSITLFDENSELMRGYVWRNNALGKRVFNYLRNGKSLPVIVDIGYAEAANDSSTVLISNFNEGWSLY